MLFWSKWSYSMSRARKHYSSFHSKFKNTTDTIDWSVCLSYYFFVFPCSLDTIRSFYGQISICGKPSMASLWEHKFLFGYRRYLFILRDIDHISDPYLHFSGLVWYEKLWERVYYSISNLWISNDRRVLHAGSSTILCFFRKRANPYVHYYRGMGFETKKDQGSISVFPLYFTWICFYAISYSLDSSPNRNHRFTNIINHRI